MVKERVRGKNPSKCPQDIKIYETMAGAMKSRAEGINMEKGNVHHRTPNIYCSKMDTVSALMERKFYWSWER